MARSSSHHTVIRWLSVAVVVIGVLGTYLGSAHRAIAYAPTAYFAPTTQQVLAEPFLTPWAEGGAFAAFGEPVSQPVELGKRTRQFFQYGALDAATKDLKKNAPKITRLPVGSELLALSSELQRDVSGRRRVGQTTPDPFLSAAAGTTSVDPAFTTFYAKHGGAEEFGAPLTDAYLRGSTRVQWFEYGRLEQPADGDVTLGPVGLELATKLGVTGNAVKQGSLPELDAKRFHTYTGDGTVPNATAVFSPTRIMIPAISVDAKIEEVSIVNGIMGTPVDAWNVGWYPQISTPGQWTNVVMAAHRDWWGIGPTVFYNLDQVKRGDMIYLVGADGTGATYKVVQSYQVGSDADPNTIVTDAGIEMLTLITCDGSFDGQEYLSRRIVRAKRI